MLNKNWVVRSTLKGFKAKSSEVTNPKELIKSILDSYSESELTQTSVFNGEAIIPKVARDLRSVFEFSQGREGNANSDIVNMYSPMLELMLPFMIGKLSDTGSESRLADFSNFIEDSSFTKSNITATTFDFWRNRVFDKILDGYNILNYKNN
jgi:hypothetical protein